MLPIRRILSVAALLLVGLCATALADVQVNNLTLVKNGQFTELTIRCSGQPEFAHQIVEQAANKPYRIVVDVKNAIHALPQHAFAKLPTGSIKQIRTSQYSTDPEKIVRVVVDAAGAVTYKISAGEFGVTLMINTPNDQNFAQWTAVPGGEVVAAIPSAPPATPKTMPAAPGNEANAPKVELTDPAKKDLKLAAKPVDEGVLLNKKPTNSSVNNSQASQPPTTPAAKPVVEAAKPQSTPNVAQQQVKEEPKPVAFSPTVTTEKKPAAANIDPKVLEAIYGTTQPQPTVAANPPTANAKPQTPATTAPNTPVQTPAKTESKPASGELKGEPAKVVDSAVIPQLQNPAIVPGTSPGEVVKPPKDQKTGLPEVKVNPKPKFAENPSVNPNAAKLGTALTANKPPAEEAGDEVDEETLPNLVDNDAEDNVKSKSEAVREKYQANRERANASIESAVDSAALADSEPANPSATKIDRIRNKYKRGIKFVQNEADEQRLAEQDIEIPVEEATPTPQVGPYSEFLPEREIVLYNSGGRIDPFEALIEDAKKSAGYDRIPDVDGLRLVGVLLDKRTSRALFEDANGYSYILQTGDRVKNGFVLSITEDRVVFQIRQYGWNRQVALELEDNQ